MLIVISLRLSTPVKTSLVNCTPWSLLNTSGLPYTRKASCKQSTQNAASMLLLIRQLSTLLMYLSMIATRWLRGFSGAQIRQILDHTGVGTEPPLIPRHAGQRCGIREMRRWAIYIRSGVAMVGHT
jgi:hypothetical protein